ncbi:MAG: lipopolysaccharide export system permease protein [Myxococcota bacterium]
MRILDRLVSATFLRIFALFLLGAPVLFVIGDLAERIDTYLQRSIPGKDIALGYVYLVPKFLLFSFPIAALIAAVFTVNAMTVHREVVAAKAGGISFRRLYMPLLFLGLILTGVGLALTEIVPRSNRRAYTLLGEHEARQGWRNRFVYQNEEGVSVSIQRLNVADASLSNVSLQRERADGEGLALHMIASSAKFEDGEGWVFHDGFLRHFPEEGPDRAYAFESYRTRWFTERPDELLEDPPDDDEMTYAQMTRMAAIITRSGGDPKELLTKREEKRAIPVATLVIILFGIPLATSAGRGGASVGIGISLASTILYLVMFRVSTGFGDSGAIPPVAAAWLPNLVFLLAGLVLMARVRT